MRISCPAVSACLWIGVLAGSVCAVDIETVPVGNPGNAPDHHSHPGSGFDAGAVGYAYEIGKYEVTAGQYAEFLNAVAVTDTYNLYNPMMANAEGGSGISRAGSPGNYTYAVHPAFVNRPVNYVSWGDAARFVNWLHNGQPAGEQGASATENGAYFLNGAMTDAELVAVARKPRWRWALPNHDEWYKAAYYDAPTATYYRYPTRSNNIPGRDLADVSGNNANYLPRDATLDPIDPPYYTTVVGQFHNSESPYGTFDQGGNVSEWNETLRYNNSYRTWAGGWYRGTYHDMASDYYLEAMVLPTTEYSLLGFRVVQVPEPCTLALLLVGMGLAMRAHR